MKGREAEGKALARSCQVCQSFPFTRLFSFSAFSSSFPIDRQSLSSEGTSRHGGKVINVCAFQTRMRVKMKNRTLPDTKLEGDVADGRSRTKGHVSGLVGGAPVYAFFNSGRPVNSRRDSCRLKWVFISSRAPSDINVMKRALRELDKVARIRKLRGYQGAKLHDITPAKFCARDFSSFLRVLRANVRRILTSVNNHSH